MKYIVHEKVKRKKYTCDPNGTLKSFTDCAFNEIRIIGCSTIINKIGKSFNQSNICTNYTIFNNKKSVIYNQFKQILRHSNSTKCIKPCKTITYEVSFREMNKNARLLSSVKPNADYISFGLYYDDFVADVRQEYFVIPIGALISSIGGFLGLFLGFSCLSITYWTSNYVRRCMK